MLSVARITYILMLERGEFDEWVEKNLLGNHRRGKELIYLTALLHDIGRWEEYLTGESHSMISARYAREFLKLLGFSAPEIEICALAIEEHRSTCTPMTVLGTYIQEADKLSRECWKCAAKSMCKNIGKMRTRFGPIL